MFWYFKSYLFYNVTEILEEWSRGDFVSLQKKNKMPTRNAIILERIMFTTRPAYTESSFQIILRSFPMCKKKKNVYTSHRTWSCSPHLANPSKCTQGSAWVRTKLIVSKLHFMEDLSRRHFVFDPEIPEHCHLDIVSAKEEKASSKVVPN